MQKIELAPGYQVSFAKRINASVSIPVIAVGLITGVEQAEAILEKGEADTIALARGALYARDGRGTQPRSKRGRAGPETISALAAEPIEKSCSKAGDAAL